VGTIGLVKHSSVLPFRLQRTLSNRLMFLIDSPESYCYIGFADTATKEQVVTLGWPSGYKRISFIGFFEGVCTSKTFSFLGT
jgi:hypothetical protein